MWLRPGAERDDTSCHECTTQAGRLEDHTRRADILMVAEHAPCTVLDVSEDRRVRVEPRIFVEPRVTA